MKEQFASALIDTQRGLGIIRFGLSSKLYERFVVIVGSLQIFLALQIILLSHYFPFDPVASISFFADDSHCDLEQGQGLGVHCFGDYSFLRNAILSGNPWSPPFYSTYTAISLSPLALGVGVELLTGSFNGGLFFYLFLLLVSLSLPWLVFVAKNKHLSLPIKALSLLVIGPLSMPSLIALDRGNSVGFVVPALMLFSIGVVSRNPILMVAGSILASFIKLQFLLLLVFLLVTSRTLYALSAGVFSLVLQVLAYAVLGLKDLSRNLLGTFENVLVFSASANRFEFFPVDISLTRQIESLLGAGPVATRLAEMDLLPTLLVGLLALSAVLGNRRHSNEMKSAVVTVFAALAAFPTYGYYLVFALVSTVMILITNSNEMSRSGLSENKELERDKERVLQLIFLLASAMSITTILFPFSTSDSGTLFSAHSLAPAVWLLCFLLMALDRILGKEQPS